MSEDDGVEGSALGASLDAAFFGYNSLLLGLVLGHDSGLLDGFLAGPTSAPALADRLGTDRRLTLEWLRVMVVADFAEHSDGIFSPLPGLSEAMNPPGFGSRAELLALRAHGMSQLLTLLTEAVRMGTGVPHTAYEPVASRCQDMFNSSTASAHLIPGILGPIPRAREVLDRGGRILDLGCGAGWAMVTLATAYPAVRLTGYDLDVAALSLARARLAAVSAETRVERRDATDLPAGAFDLILAIDTIHDLGDPAGALAAAAASLRPGGIFVMAETDATGDFDIDRHGAARAEYFTSLAMCIPVSQASGGPGLGSLWGRAAAMPMLTEAGFTETAVHSAPPGYAVYAARVTSQ